MLFLQVQLVFHWIGSYPMPHGPQCPQASVALTKKGHANAAPSLINWRWPLHLGWKARIWTGDEPSQVWYYRDSWWSASMLKVSWRLQYGNEQSWFGVKLFPSMINKKINGHRWTKLYIDKCSSTPSQTIWISTKLHFKFTRHGSEFAWPRFHGEAMISKDSGAL